MALSRVMDRSADARIDVRLVAQVTALGALADDVVADLLWAEAGRDTLKTSTAIKRAAEVFEQLAEEATSPVTIWQRRDVSNALRRMTAAQAIAAEASHRVPTSQDPGSAGLRVIADALAHTVERVATPSELKLLREYFQAISSATIESASESVHARGGAASTWSTI